MSLSPGDRIDRYEVIELLGSGGMGEVYRAHDPKLSRDVALKILRVSEGLDANGSARLLREARAAAALSHANVLAVYDVGEVEGPEGSKGLAYIAMELVIGQPLRAYLGDEGVPIERRLDWLRDVARALEAAHQAGIVHRDVKAENVMIRADGVVKVLDFGIARRAEANLDDASATGTSRGPTADTARAQLVLATLTRQGAVIGTPFYMAPEQLRGEELDARVDQFAFGVLAYWLLTGKPPWRETSDSVALLSEILLWSPPPPAEQNPRISGAVSDAILRALEKKRGARFASMGALLAAIGGDRTMVSPAAVPTGELPPVGSGPGGVARRLVAWRRLLVATVAVAALGLAGVIPWRVRSARHVAAAGAEVGTKTMADGCASNADCVRTHGGGAWHCNTKRHACVGVESEDCKANFEPGDPEADDMVWFGGMIPLHDPKLNFTNDMRTAEIARKDFAAALGKSAGRTGASHVRPLGFVVCDEGADAMRAARHLAEDVEVPAVLGFFSKTAALDTISSVFLPNDVLSFITISQSPSLTSIPEPPDKPRLIWRASPNRADFAAPLSAFISEILEPAIRRGPRGIGNKSMRVATVWASSANHETALGLFETLRFNGRSVLENGPNFQQFVYENEADGGPIDVTAALLAFAPQIVIYASKGFYNEVLRPLEAAWSEGARGLPRPIYLTSSSFGPRVAEFAGTDASKRHRFFAVSNRSATPTGAKLALRYNVAFPMDPVTVTSASQAPYDAVHVLAYATYALGDAPVTGPALSRAIDRLLPPGRNIDVGGTRIGEAFQILRSGGQIDLNGSEGALDFDRETGEAPMDYSIVCASVDDHGRTGRAADSGLFYDARAKKLVGELHCP